MNIFPIHLIKKTFCRFISEHELESVLDKVHLSERYYARQQAVHSISEVRLIFLPSASASCSVI
jgi:hypothetical protein